ncbi:MAG TPA: MlaD family protein [Polyangia bacterium]|nr:MlaD family protein [Polyangia bacterium]
MSPTDELTGEPSRLELKVGLFVILLLAAGAGVVLLLGLERHVFENRVRLHAVFDEVAGLREGAPVWLSGVNVGTVTHIAFTARDREHEREPIRVRVDLEIARKHLPHVHQDSVARVGSQGLLGDKIVEVSIGSPASPPAKPDDTLPTQSPADFDKLMAQASDILEKGQVIAARAAVAMNAFAEPKTLADLKGSIGSVRHLLHAVESGPGLAHALFYDRRSADDLRAVAGELHRLTSRVDDGVAQVDRILHATDKDGAQVINNMSRAARNLGDAAAELRDSKIIARLDRASADVVDLTGAIKSGQGTLGALIVDPTVYEQLVTVLGGVQRSRILRALVRFAIRKDDGRSVGQAVDQPATPANRNPPPKLEKPQQAATPRVKQ